jgi:hypothetical protein
MMKFVVYFTSFIATAGVGVFLFRKYYKQQKSKYIATKLIEGFKNHHRHHHHRSHHISKIIAKNKKH